MFFNECISVVFFLLSLPSSVEQEPLLTKQISRTKIATHSWASSNRVWMKYARIILRKCGRSITKSSWLAQSVSGSADWQRMLPQKDYPTLIGFWRSTMNFVPHRVQCTVLPTLKTHPVYSLVFQSYSALFVMVFVCSVLFVATCHCP